MESPDKQNPAFTLIELLAIIGVVGIVVIGITLALGLPAFARAKAKAQRISCTSNLKQIGLAFRTWAVDNMGKTPMTLGSTNSGVADTSVGIRVLAPTQSESWGVSRMFLCVSNELYTPRVLLCPAEYETAGPAHRQRATTFREAAGPGMVPFTNDLNCSYFVGVDAVEIYPQMLMTGDHNVGDGDPPTELWLAGPNAGSPFHSLGTNFPAGNQCVGWSSHGHNKQGNVGLADGSVQGFTRPRLQEAAQYSGDPGKTSYGPFNCTGTASPAGYNRIQLP
jgi:prepilin-type processing-associated H-X9-DG protein